MAAPTLASYGETAAWNTGGTSKAVSMTWLTGDILVVLAGAEDSSAVLGTPTATGLTFTKQQDIPGSSSCAGFVATAVAGAGGTGVNVTVSGPAGLFWGFGVWVYRSSDGVGASAQQNTSTKTKSLTTTQDNSAVVWGMFDWGAGGTFTATPAPTNTDENQQISGRYSIGVFDKTDNGTAGAISFGASAGGSASGPFALVICEIKGTASGGGGQPTSKRWGGVPFGPSSSRGVY